MILSEINCIGWEVTDRIVNKTYKESAEEVFKNVAAQFWKLNDTILYIVTFFHGTI